jgi:hypothetical protein
MTGIALLYGPDRLIADLGAAGHHEVEKAEAGGNTYVIIRNYTVMLGRFDGRLIDLGILVPPDYPRTMSAAVHVRANPQLIEKDQTVPNVRNITDSALGAEWRYWSKNFSWTEERTTRRLLTQINEIFLNA